MLTKAVSDIIEKTEKMRHDISRRTQQVIERRLNLLEEAVIQKRFEPKCLALFDLADRNHLATAIAFVSKAEQRFLLERIAKAREMVDNSIKELEFNASLSSLTISGELPTVSIVFGAGYADSPQVGEKVKIVYGGDTLLGIGVVNSVRTKEFGHISRIDLYGTQYYALHGDACLKALTTFHEKKLGRHISLSESVTIVRWKYLQH